MPNAGVRAVAERALSDPKWVAEYRANPDAALAAFDLTSEERAALKRQDAGRLQELGIGVDERITKGMQLN